MTGLINSLSGWVSSFANYLTSSNLDRNETIAPFLEVDLQKEDPITFDSFEVLKNQMVESGEDYYICAVQANGVTFFYDATTFINYVNSRFDFFGGNQQNIVNPATNTPAKRFDVYAFSLSEKGNFKLHMKQEELLINKNYLSILYSDPSCEKNKRNEYMVTHAGKLKNSNNIEKAIQVYKKAINNDCMMANFLLARLLFSQENETKKNKDIVISHLDKALEIGGLCSFNLFAVSQTYIHYDAYKKAYLALHELATRSNIVGMTYIIMYLEEGREGVEKKLELAREWRSKLPGEWSEWQNQPIRELLNHLRKRPPDDYLEDSEPFPFR